MDTHYDQVMKARADGAGAPSRLYFAYSTVLDRPAFESWLAEHSYPFFTLPEGVIAEAPDLDLVFDFPSRFWGGRVAGLVDRPGARVFGRLFEIPGADWPVVEHKEGALTGMCVARQVRVRKNGEELVAFAFTTRPERASADGPISQRFVLALAQGAEAAQLPTEYVERLRSLASQDPPLSPPAVRQIPVVELKAMLDSSARFELFDVRTDEERTIAKIERARHLNDEGHKYLLELDRNTPVVFLCHHGIRSRSAAEYALREGFKNVGNVQGGIDAWSLRVDPKVSRY